MLRKATINLSQKRHCRHPQLVNTSQSKLKSSSSCKTLLDPCHHHLQGVPHQVQSNQTLQLVNNYSSFSSLPLELQQQHKQKIKPLNDVNHMIDSSFVICGSNHDRRYTCLNITPTNCTSSTIHVGNNNHLQIRLFSSDNKKSDGKNNTGWESSSSSKIRSNGSGNTKGNGGKSGDGVDNSFYGLGRERGLIGLGIITTGIISLPVITRELQNSKNEYQEVEINDEMYDEMKDVSSEMQGEISKRILGEELSQQLGEGGKKKAVDNTVTLVSDVLNSDALQNAITNLIARVVGSAQFQSACQMLLKNLWDDLINDPETTSQVVALLNTAIKDERIKKSFQELVLGLLADEEVYKELTGLVVRLGEEKEILDATRELLTESAHRALNDPEILDHSMEFATDVVGDNVLQKTSGEALRNTVTYAVKPSLSTFLSVFGVALLIFSASALGNARLSARQGRDIDAAASVVVERLGATALDTVSKILFIPGKAISGFTSAIISTILYPFQLIGKTAVSIGYIGNEVMSSFVDLFLKATSFPAFVRDAISLSYTIMMGSMSTLLNKSYSWISSAPELFVSQFKIWLSSLGGLISSGSRQLGDRLVAAIVSLFTTTGAKVSNVCGSIITTNRSRVDKAGAEILSVLSNFISYCLAFVKRGGAKGTST